MRLVFIIVKKGSHKMPLKNSILRKKASAYLVMLEGCFGLVFFKLLIFCALTHINFFFTQFDEKKNWRQNYSSSCSRFQEAFNIALFNFVSTIGLNDFLNTSKGFFETVE
jgi:hypothetical protein